jgi:pRiA4b ORF-3-like protein
VCVDGQNACPPEDCGGAGGYAELLAALGDPEHEEHEDLLDWLGDGFDPASFDLIAVNVALQHLR